MSVRSIRIYVTQSPAILQKKQECGRSRRKNLYECMAETYVPLLNAISELYDEGIKAKLTVGITPILAEQLNDEHLKHGFVEYLDSRIKKCFKRFGQISGSGSSHSQHFKISC